MSKWLYIAIEFGQGVYEALDYTFDKQEAIDRCEYDYIHLTKQERKERELWVEGYDLSAYEFEVMPDETAQEAFKRWADSLDAVGLPDPDDYLKLH